jgi:hypothetical protein
MFHHAAAAYHGVRLHMLDLGWIHEENASALPCFFAEQLWHDFSTDERQAFLSEMATSNAEKGAWSEIELGPGPILRLAFARDDPGSSVVMVRADGDASVLVHVLAVVQFLQRYIVKNEA